MTTIWRALVTNGTFYEVLEEHRARMEKEGLRVVPESAGNLTASQIHELGKDVDIIFGPSVGLDAELFKNVTRLKVVALASSGYESVDVKAATDAGIVVTHAPTPLGSEAVADLTFGLMICVAREIPQCHYKLVTSGKLVPVRVSDRPMGKAVWGKTLGIVGLGHIGKAVARRACGFSMRLLAFEFDAFWDAEFAARYNIERTDLDTLLRESDYVSLHLRISASTLGIIGARELALMKPTAYLINTARASLVDEKALYDALATRHIAGAGLDTVIDSGPDNPLIGLPNVVCTPHLGNRCIDSVHDVVDTAIDNALAVLRGKRPNYVVNPEVYSLCYPQPHQPHLYPS